jgi:hypothetical protein
MRSETPQNLDSTSFPHASEATQAPDAHAVAVVHAERFDGRSEQLLARHPVVPWAPSNPLYAIPEPLCESLHNKLPGWFSEQEFAFERDLANFCNRRSAAGIVDGIPIPRSMIVPERLPPVSRKLFEELGWGKELTFESMQQSLAAAEKSLPPLYDGHQAYLGWLLTNPQYLVELNAFKQDRIIPYPRLGFQLRHPTDDFPLRQFLGRWQLSSFASWELPVPQGENLTGEPWPESITAFQARIQVSLPVTTRLPARWPLGQTLEHLRKHQTPSHLRPWTALLKRQTPSRYQNLFRLHFYRNIVLLSRYADRLSRNVQQLDGVFSEYLGLSESEIKQLRLLANRRLSSQAKKHSNSARTSSPNAI